MKFWIWLVAGVLLGADWIRRSVAAAQGTRKLADITSPEWDCMPRSSAPQPSLRVVVPARNEEQKIEQCLRSLLALDYPEVEICAVDDRSTDATGAIMDRLRCEFGDRLKVIHIRQLPEGWLGKTHAMWEGARESPSDWILFTDGDVLFRPDSMRRALVYAELHNCDHLVLLPTMIMHKFGERMMLGFFSFASMLFLRAWKVRDPKARDAIGTGAFNLVRRSVYEAIGTYAALRAEVIDDLRLGESIKRHGFRQDCVLGHRLVSLRWAAGAFGVVDNLRKNLFGLFRFRWWLAALASLAALIYHLGPWLGIVLAPGYAKVGFAVALCSVALHYLTVSRYSRISPWYFVTQPVGAVMFVYSLLNSAFSYLIHGGVMWRGTIYKVGTQTLAAKQDR